VAGENIKFLIMCRMALGESDLLGNITRAMDNFVAMQQPAPQAGWSLQYTLDDKPVAARTYEPESLATHTTATNTQQLLNFYKLTGDAKFLARVPEALDWLDKVKLSPELAMKFGRTHPTFVELMTDEALYVHRRGSNVVNGQYYSDKSPEKTLGHYSPSRQIDVADLRKQYDELLAKSPADVAAGSPLKITGPVDLPRYFSLREVKLDDLFAGVKMTTTKVKDDEAKELVDSLDPKGYWPTKLEYITNTYIGPGSSDPYMEDTYASTYVGDLNDTSPYKPATPPATYQATEAPLGITVDGFIKNMSVLIAYVAPIE
jgi:hypothetical protein